MQASTEARPFKNWSITSNPKWSDNGSKPTALDTLNLPPTQSQKPKTFSRAIPKASVAVWLVLTAQRCARKAASASAFSTFWLKNSTIYLLIVLALSMVSAVVKVLETITKMVCSKSMSARARLTSVGSTLARNLSLRSWDSTCATESKRSASYTNSGPR